MSEPMGESLSALLDTEADDLDLQRVLNALGSDDQAVRRWRRYNLISAAMRNELDQFAGVDLSARVRDSLAGEVPVEWRQQAAVAGGRWRAWQRPAASVAVAASVTAAILTGTQIFTAGDEPGFQGLGAVAEQFPSGPVGPVAAIGQTAGFGEAPLLVAPTGGADIERGYRIADEMARLRLEAYLQNHIEHASLNTSNGMMPFARAAVVEGGRQ